MTEKVIAVEEPLYRIADKLLSLVFDQGRYDFRVDTFEGAASADRWYLIFNSKFCYEIHQRK